MMIGKFCEYTKKFYYFKKKFYVKYISLRETYMASKIVITYSKCELNAHA